MLTIAKLRQRSMAEIAGVSRSDVSAWSQRSTQLRQRAAGHLDVEDQEPTAAQLATAQKATRTRKPEELSWAALRAQWADDERRFGVDIDAQRAARQARQHAPVDHAAVARQAVTHDLTAATFTRADLVEAIGARLPVDDTDDRPPRAVIEALADGVTQRIGNERAPHQREGSIRYTAADLITEERAIIELTGGGC